VDKNQSYPGTALCHNGQSLYFKNQSFCLKEAMNRSCSDLKISALLTAESIYTNDNQNQGLLRFYSLERSFVINVYSETAPGSSNYELSDMVTHDLPSCDSCEDCQHQQPETSSVVYSERQVVNSQEKAWVEKLIRHGFSIINAPPGPVLGLENVNLDSEGIDLEKIRSELLESNIATPFCNNTYDSELIHLMGGELSGGGGISAAAFHFLQELSAEISQESPQSEGLLRCENEVWI
jgi:hypothetical protein